MKVFVFKGQIINVEKADKIYIVSAGNNIFKLMFEKNKDVYAVVSLNNMPNHELIKDFDNAFFKYIKEI